MAAARVAIVLSFVASNEPDTETESEQDRSDGYQHNGRDQYSIEDDPDRSYLLGLAKVLEYPRCQYREHLAGGEESESWVKFGERMPQQDVLDATRALDEIGHVD